MPGDLDPVPPKTVEGVLWVFLGVLFFWLKGIVNKFINANITNKKSDKIEKLEQDVEDLRRAQRRLEGRQDFVEDSSAAVARLTKAKDDG